MRDSSQLYEFRVVGELGPDWYEWFDGFEITARDGMTVICGRVVDQSALYGMIAKLAGLGLTLLSLNCRQGPVGSSQEEQP